MTDVLPPTPEGIRRAAALLADGEVVAFPTDTVHGVGCRPFDPIALERLFRLKDRPVDRRIGSFVADLDQARGIGLVVDERAERLAARFWPGGLTLVLPTGPDADPSLGPTLGVRSPDHPVARDLLTAAGPLPQTSANPHGLPETRSTDDVLVAFAPVRDDLAAVVDGVSPGGLASTVLDLSVTPARVLREGPVTRAELAELVELAD